MNRIDENVDRTDKIKIEESPPSLNVAVRLKPLTARIKYLV
ncbi:MAG: hypothetical protein HW387_1175 [Parachlamydiales bacterium]|nr:hypothetical protein [Parachlamydiales bacterium]